MPNLRINTNLENKNVKYITPRIHVICRYTVQNVFLINKKNVIFLVLTMINVKGFFSIYLYNDYLYLVSG